MKRTIALVALTLFALTGATTASAAGVGDSEPCKAGGYAKYVDPVTAKPFASQGRCISFVNEGGTLVSVSPTPPAGGGTADIKFVNLRLGDGGWYWDVELSGLPADSVVEVSYTQTPPNRAKVMHPLVLTQADGTASLAEADGYNREWRYGPCGLQIIRDITIRGAGFKVTEALPVPPACAP